MNDNLVRKLQMNCPLCDKDHEIQERTRTAHTVIKGEEVEYVEIYYLCNNSEEEENEFVTGKINNINLQNARNVYRINHGLLTSNEIVDLREQYGLSQVDLARLLGWGEATISRYESKAIQDDAYDNVLRIIKDNSLIAYEFLQKNHSKFSNEKYKEIKQKITENLDSHGREYLKRQLLECDYVDYLEPSDDNGYQRLDIDKLESAISYFAEFVPNLYKVKLMKMLWYADVLMFKERGSAITGLVYCHEAMGALPVGHYRIVGLENIKVEEEEGFDYTVYHFLPKKDFNITYLVSEEVEILNRVIKKFKDFGAKEIVKYMHKENAYKETKPGDIIPFSLAADIDAF